MTNPLTQLNRFFDAATEQTLSGNDQLVYLHLFNKFNRARWPETILVRDAELLELCGLYDGSGKRMHIDTIRRAKARLKKKGFIDFTSGTGCTPTEYRMLDLHPADTPADPPADTPADPLGSSYIRVHGDIKDIHSFIHSNARARDSNGLDEVIEYWERDLHGGRLSIEHQGEIAAWIEKHGVEWVKTVMREASDINGRVLNMKLLRGAVKYKLNPPQPSAPKGGEKHGRSKDIDYSKLLGYETGD